MSNPKRPTQIRLAPPGAMKNPPMGFGRWILFLIIVILPYSLVAVSTWYVYPDGFWITLGCLVIGAGVAAVFTHYCDQATRKIKRHCVVSHFILLIISCVNLGMHFGLTRELSAARRSTAERRTDEDRRINQAKELADAQVKVNQSNQLLAESQAKVMRQENIRVDQYRRNGYRVAPPAGPKTPAVSASGDITSLLPPSTTSSDHVVYLTEEKVMEKWGLALTIWAFVDAMGAMLLGGLLWARWEWDRNGDDIDDAEQLPGKA